MNRHDSPAVCRSPLWSHWYQQGDCCFCTPTSARLFNKVALRALPWDWGDWSKERWRRANDNRATKLGVLVLRRT